MNRIYLITGAAGHLGSVVARQLLDKEETVRALVLPGENISLKRSNLLVMSEARKA